MAEPQELSMERRFLLFFVMAIGVMWLFMQLQRPAVPPKPPQVAEQEAEKKGKGEVAVQSDAEGQEPAEQPEIAADPPVDLQFPTLGSVDPASSSRMLVTFTNEGGGVRRVELTSPKGSQQFFDLHDRNGYLGHMELLDEARGPQARVVGEGTPAFKSGLRAGDVITGILLPDAKEITPVAKAADLQNALATTEPRNKVRLTVSRDGETKQLESARLTRRPLEVIRPEIENILLYAKQAPEGHVDQPSFLVQLQKVDDKKATDDSIVAANKLLARGNWQIEAARVGTVAFRQKLPELGLEFVKRYTLTQVPADEQTNQNYPAYDFQMECEVRNLNSQKCDVEYALLGPNGLPIEGWWYATKVGRGWSAAGLRDVLYRFPSQTTAEFTASAIASGDAGIQEHIGGHGVPFGLVYAGVDAQYFASMMIPVRPNIEAELFNVIRPEVVGPQPAERWPRTYTNVSFRMIRKPLALAAAGQADDKATDQVQVFNGPKRPALLAQYEAANDPVYTLEDILTYGWFGLVAKLMLGILHTFYAVVKNYGIAIILLTVLVRGMMFPLSRKQAMNMAKMQELSPEIKKIAEKYKNEVEKRTKAQQELFRKHNYNPMGGCLLMLLQLPIFIGLYRSLMVDVELRDAALFTHAIRWCSNLAAPDMLYDWSWFMPTFIQSYLGPYLNVLPLVTVGLFIVQQKLFMPPPANEQAAMQMKIMPYMMAFMGLLFFKVACGLCIYFIASSLWGMAERKLLPKPKPAESADGGASGVAVKPTPPAPSGDRNGAPKGKGNRDKARSKAKRRK